MLITERMAMRAEESETDAGIVHAITECGYALAPMTTRELAALSCASPASVVRLSKALGFAGFNEFKQALLEEMAYLDAAPAEVDANVPFSAGDSPVAVANKVAGLHESAIRDTRALLRPESLAAVCEMLRACRSIHVFSQGTLLNDAESFREKMLKVGMFVSIPSNLNYQQYEAACLGPDDLAIVISYSGETPATLQTARVLHARRVPLLALTSIGENNLARLADCVLSLATRERLFHTIGDFETHASAKYLLDVIYSLYFSMDYERSYREKQARVQMLERARTSSSEVLMPRPLQRS